MLSGRRGEDEFMMSIDSKRELLAVTVTRYRAANKAQKARILDEFIVSTHYNRKYAIGLLNQPVAPRTKTSAPRMRKHTYTEEVEHKLIAVWEASNGLCAQRLVPFLPEFVPVLERCGELVLDPDSRALLLNMSVGTAGRILSRAQRSRKPFGLSTTKPGTLLKDQILIRTFSDWNEDVPGFLEIDLVAHCGETTSGEYLNTLVLTDVKTGWTEPVALRNRSQHSVSEAINDVRHRLAFAMLGLDSDNGSEFINNNLLRYCDEEMITFTRSRPYKKNDQCYVEQKNYSVVRRIIGYARFEEEAACRHLAAVYRSLRLYVNFFQPSMKLISKERNGAKVKKRYDVAQTPYRRVLACPQVPDALKDRLTAQYDQLDPTALWEQIQHHRAQLWRSTATP
jgi:hypothetical protein